MNFPARRELQNCAGNIATWSDRYQPPETERNARLGAFPYLSDDYALTERVPGITPWISDIHLFAIASSMSFGASGSSINAMTTAIPKLVHGLTRGLFRADIERYWASFQAYDVPQASLSKQPEAAAKTIGLLARYLLRLPDHPAVSALTEDRVMGLMYSKRMLSAGAVLAFLTAAAPVHAQTRAETLRYVTGAAVNTLDPNIPGSTREAFAVSLSTYDRLVSFGRKQLNGKWVFDLDSIRGELAESYTV
eukprot:gene14571-19278_t